MSLFIGLFKGITLFCKPSSYFWLSLYCKHLLYIILSKNLLKTYSLLSISPAGSKLFIKSGPTITETVGTVGVNWTPSNTNSLTVQDEIMKL